MTARATIEAAIGRTLTGQENAELYILLQGGATQTVIDLAVEAYWNAYRVNDDWGYLRTVILTNTATRARLTNPRLEEAPHG